MHGMEAANNIVAPFVLKTYQMVNDPATSGFITWGSDNNSFIVLEPLEFSRRILPIYFKHNNFSSFVRQLNTYGFRKVDPDKWEFATEWFLRGQTQLLTNISRRKHSNKLYTSHNVKYEEDDEEELIVEIANLKQEQQSLEQELQSMNRRLEATERRPQQMMTFLYKVAEDPEILPRMMLEKEKMRRLTFSDGEKKRKLMISATSSNSSSIKSQEDQEGNKLVENTPTSSPNANFDVDTYSSPSFEMSSPEWFSHRQSTSMPMFFRQEHQNYTNISRGFAMEQHMTNRVADGVGTNYFQGPGSAEDSSPQPPYPFSLLGGGF